MVGSENFSRFKSLNTKLTPNPKKGRMPVLTHSSSFKFTKEQMRNLQRTSLPHSRSPMARLGGQSLVKATFSEISNLKNKRNSEAQIKLSGTATFGKRSQIAEEMDLGVGKGQSGGAGEGGFESNLKLLSPIEGNSNFFSSNPSEHEPGDILISEASAQVVGKVSEISDDDCPSIGEFDG